MEEEFKNENLANQNEIHNYPLHDDQAGEATAVTDRQKTAMRKKKSRPTIAIMQTQKVEWLTSFTLADILKFEKYLRSVRGSNTLVERQSWITQECKYLIALVLKTKKIPDWEEWENWDDQKFFLTLKRVCPTPTSQHLGANSNLLADRVKALKLVIDLDNLEKVFPYFTQLNELVEQDAQHRLIEDGDAKANHKEIIKELVLGLARNGDLLHKRLSELMKKDGFPENFVDYEEKLLKILFELSELQQNSKLMGMSFHASNDNSKNNSSFRNQNGGAWG